jgi:hypothetical protein
MRNAADEEIDLATLRNAAAEASSIQRVVAAQRRREPCILRYSARQPFGKSRRLNHRVWQLRTYQHGRMR